MESRDVSHDVRHAESPGPRAHDAGGPVSKLRKRWRLQRADCVTPLVDVGTKCGAHDLEVRLSLLVAELLALSGRQHVASTKPIDARPPQYFLDSRLRFGRDPRRALSRQRMPPKERRETGRHRRASLDVQQVAGALDRALLDLPEPGPQAIGHFDP